MYDRTIRVTRPTPGGYASAASDARYASGAAALVYTGSVDVQDEPRTLDQTGPGGDPIVMLEALVFFQETGAIEDNGIKAGDFAAITGGAIDREGQIQSVRGLDDTLVIAWAEA